MKKIVIAFVATMLLSLLGILLIRGVQQETEVTKKENKVGLVLNGPKDDRSWGQSQYMGLMKAAEELNLSVVCAENVPEDRQCRVVMDNLIQDGCEIIVCDSIGYGEHMAALAQRHPEIYFFHAAGLEGRKNMVTYFGRMYQMRYLSGMVAGLQTETNEIGFVAGLPIDEVNRGINAFTLGVQRVNQKAKVHVIFTKSWTGEKESKEATEKLLTKVPKIDVLTMHVNAMAPLEIAEERGIWSIGYNLDNSDLFPKTFLTAPIWNWEKYYTPHILKCLQGKLRLSNTTYWEGLESGLIELAKFTPNVKTGIREQVKAVHETMKKGHFDVFYGPIYDTEGTLRVDTGECMPDDKLLHEFDWYVKGVEIHE